MTRPPSKPETITWHGDPTRDYTTYLLLRLARAALVSYFEDGANEEDYTELQAAKASRGRRTGKPRPLANWDDSNGCTVVLMALPDNNRFSLEMRHAGFTAELNATFDPMTSDMEAAGVVRFSGDARGAAEAINIRFDAITEDDLDLGLDHLALFGGTDIDGDPVAIPDDDPEQSDAPPPPSDEDIRELERLAQRLRRHLIDDKAPDLTDRDQQWLETTPQILWGLLDATLHAAQAEPQDAHLIAAWRFLLSNQLGLIRYRAERGWPWADGMLDEYQDRIIDLASNKQADSMTLFMLVAALNHAKVVVKPELGEAVVNAGEGSLDALPPTAQAIDTMLRPVIDELAASLDTPFEAIEALEEVTSVAPPELRVFLAHELALSPHAVLRESVPLMLLDDHPEVRRAAAAALEQTAAPDTLSPASLRRTIALRNWVPEADRAAIDQVIRKARTKGVEIAQWDNPADLAPYASPIDGSGAQSLLLATRSGRMGLFCGVLTKDGSGVRDAWCNKNVPRREIASGLAEVQRALGSPEVERAYFDTAIQHHIAIGLANDHLPGSALLEIAEAAGGTDWKDRRIDVAAETDRMFGELPPAERGAEAIDASLRRSGTWASTDRMAETWFEDYPAIRDAVAQYKGRDPAVAARKLLTGVMQERRGVWAERCLLMTLWVRAIKNARKAPPWQDFLVLAHELLTGRALTEIPAMMHIAGRSAAAARSGKW